MQLHLASPHKSSDIGRGHHRQVRLSIGKHSTHEAELEQAKQTFAEFVAQGGRGRLDITTFTFFMVDWACFVYHGQASHALRPYPSDKLP